MPGKDEDENRTTLIPVAGQCSSRLHHFNMSSGSPTKRRGAASRRLKHSHTVSQRWLERCKPDLTEFDPTPQQPSDGEEEEDNSGVEAEEEETDESEDDHGREENESLGEEEEVWEEEKGVELMHVEQECLHGNSGEQCSLPPLGELSTLTGYEDRDEMRGYSWDDNDEGDSDGDSSGGDDPVISSKLDKQFETKWEELSNSVTSLSPLKQLPVGSSQISSQSSKKHLILAPRTTSTTATAGDSLASPSLPSNGSSGERTGLSHLRDGMTLLELYGSDDHTASAQPSPQSLVQQLSSSAESATKPHSNSRNTGKKINLWKLTPSAHAKNYVDVGIASPLSSTLTKHDDASNHTSSTDSPQHPSKPHPSSKSNHLPSSQQVHALSNSTSTREESYLLSRPNVVHVSNSMLATIDLEADQEHHTSARDALDLNSDIDLLSQEPHVTMQDNSVSVTSNRGRSSRRGRGRVQSAASVITEVQQTEEDNTEEDTYTPNKVPGESHCHRLNSSGRDSHIVEESGAKTKNYERYHLLVCTYDLCMHVHVNKNRLMLGAQGGGKTISS